ncbi:pyrroline-5-carboxylate reductase [Mycolicibacter nonchromogenicus]|uniref:Pyrroline-5-carboxylate reductase n=1 Tax=Mycolicibacter nonchromogenicus TaxID=1782 RepID=A0A1X1ZCT6_MYCNO|nr:pyrroline-5-carboxylate reductase [Mycolicibacter nonchromogenicus]ORW21142.1 pyrroline-5-carboxylate reductase [Mycolicibacter nonchromogenicus]
MTRIAIIGGGNMGEALLAGLLAAGRPVKDLVVAERYGERARQLSEKYSVLVTSVADAIENAAIVIVAVKPQDVDAVVAEFAKSVAAASGDSVEQVLVTIVAGLTTGYVESKLPAGAAVVRVMPNTPVKVGAGASALAKGRFASNEQVSEVAALFECVGTVAIVPEDQMDAVTAVSGSGPAYFFLVVEALVDAGVAAGLSRPAATELAVQTMAGSAQMLLDRQDGAEAGSIDTSPAHLRAMVTSPGGTTAAALRELEAGGLRSAIDRAVQAAKTRSEQLRITSE